MLARRSRGRNATTRPAFSSRSSAAFTAAAPYIAGSAVLELAYLTLLAAAYRRADLSVVYPIARGGAPVLVLVAGAVALGVTTTLAERRDRGRAAGAGPSGAVTVARIAGAVFVAAGSACWP